MSWYSFLISSVNASWTNFLGFFFSTSYFPSSFRLTLTFVLRFIGRTNHQGSFHFISSNYFSSSVISRTISFDSSIDSVYVGSFSASSGEISRFTAALGNLGFCSLLFGGMLLFLDSSSSSFSHLWTSLSFELISSYVGLCCFPFIFEVALNIPSVIIFGFNY